MILDDIGSACPSQLFSPWLATENSQTSSFGISTVGIEAGTRVEYTVLVLHEAFATQRLNLTLHVAPQSDRLVFPSNAMLRAASKSIHGPVSYEEPSYRCFESIILSWKQNVSEEMDFKLFREGQEAEILANATDGLVISYDGYWTRERPFGRFFGVSASLLAAGRYTLHGAVNKTAAPGMGTSWRFSVQPCSTLVVGDLPITTGSANQTVFHAAAYSLPSSENLFAFMLRADEASTSAEGAGENLVLSGSLTCLNGCTGKAAVSFTVPRAGQYRIVVEMYDPSGSYLLGSETSNSTITVTGSGAEEEMQALDTSVVEVLNSTLLHRDESKFVDSLLSIRSSGISLDGAVADLLTSTLKRIVSGPAVNALQCTQYVKACASVLSFDALNSTSVENTLGIIDTAVKQSVWSGSPGFHLRQALREFYGTATRSVYDMAQRRAGGGGVVDEEVRVIADRTRRSAAQAMPLVLSAGRTCGVVDSERVDVSGMVGVGGSEEREGLKAFDDYRIGVSCYAGQVRRLTPEPATVQACARDEDGGEQQRDEDGSIFVLSSVEQHNVLEHSAGRGTLGGPQNRAGARARARRRLLRDARVGVRERQRRRAVLAAAQRARALRARRHAVRAAAAAGGGRRVGV
ncbi:hypothetical protein FGB62_93g047 [Gracilaria domingensis]|nr:hypothetical protein FGB62_93g047 [Gracilaria domingensis]